jgi:hypothetical protein
MNNLKVGDCVDVKTVTVLNAKGQWQVYGIEETDHFITALLKRPFDPLTRMKVTWQKEPIESKQ